MKIDQIVSFVSRLIYYIEEKNTSFDKAFIYTRNDLKVKRPLRLYYVIGRDVVSKYFFLRDIAREFFGRASRKNIVRTWIVLYGENYAELREATLRLKKKLSKRGKVVSPEALLEELSCGEKLSVKYSVPLWIVEKLSKYMSFQELEQLFSSMAEETVWLRVNTLKISVREAMDYLTRKHVEVELDEDYEFMLRVKESRAPVYALKYVREGKLVIQDKGSVAIVDALTLERNDYILDLCAAPGLKTSLIFQLLENQCRVLACDISWDRIKIMKKLLRLHGVDLSKVDVIKADSREVFVRKGCGVTKVLVDAPCSSSGVMSKDPAIRIQLSLPNIVEKYSNLQRSLLEAALSLPEVHSIVYSTCSILPEEGEKVVDYFVSKGYKCLTRTIGSSGYRGFLCSTKVKRLFPHIHGTCGFFVAGLAD
ncbi:MAG: hypothetical protein DRJ52_08600 [Thermoprotei archaeon]|nr:MAG: hypothetical protein DRJ52_08600 [Thermoprotei archaeon]RLF00648.1 MAG: hypothetical protein DRJ63_01785 [Thermoprotei archaeon]HDI74911.1 RsmB/NOP family class I SAM-dependent RNA methyltransferase [Thermoprotei archaeon]